MMRKDVKLGFAIGGVLLAVVVVYALVGTEKSENGGAAIVTEDTSSAARSGAAKPDTIRPDAGKPDASRPDPGRRPEDVAADAMKIAGSPATAPSDVASADSHGDLWDKALNNGQLMLSQTPTPVAREDGVANNAGGNMPGGNISGGNIPGGGEANRAAPGDSHADAQHPTAAETQARANGPATLRRPSDAGMTESAPADSASSSSALSSHSAPALSSPSRAMTHVVQKDETLVMIAKAVYGNAAYYPHILRANPGLDPKRMKPGMTITLPAITDVKPTGEPASGGGASQSSDAPRASRSSESIDPRTQYVVESGDTLERIALKLYGKREMIDRIAELNKDTLPDRNKLKLHQVLRLPEPPTQTASR